MKKFTPFLFLFLLFACKKHNGSSSTSSSSSADTTGTWIQVSKYAGDSIADPIGFAIEGQLYIGMGSATLGTARSTQMLTYVDTPNAWSLIANYPYPTLANSGIGFSIGTTGYVLLNNDTVSELYAYNQEANTWTKLAGYPGELTTATTAFSIAGKAYIGFGASLTSGLHTFYVYDPGAFNWSTAEDFPGTQNAGTTCFVVGNYAYIGTGGVSPLGKGATLSAQFYRFDAINDAWKPCADFPGTLRSFATGFSVGAMGYIVGGVDVNGNYLKDVWRYDPTADKWSQLADFPGGARASALGFSSYPSGYVGFGHGATAYSDLWQYKL